MKQKMHSELRDLGENKYYKQLLEYVDSIDLIDAKDWSILHVIAYIISEYKKKFGYSYTLSFTGAVSKSVEYKFTSRMKQMLQVKTDCRLLKEYVDWFYANYNGEKRFVSFGALCKLEMINKFIEMKDKQSRIYLSDKLPENVLELLNGSSLSYAKTYKDVLFIYNYSLKCVLSEIDKQALDNVLKIVNLSEVVQ